MNRTCDNELHEDIEADVVYDDGSAWCEDCHDANLSAAAAVADHTEGEDRCGSS